MMYKKMIIFFIILCFSFLFVGCDIIKREIDDKKTLNATGITSVEINTTSTDINVYSKDTDKIEAYLYGSIITNDESNLLNLTLEKIGDRAIIDVKRDNSFIGISFNNEYNVKVDVYLPKDYSQDLIVKGTSSELEIIDVKPKLLKVSTSSGDMKIDDVQSERVNLKASSGEISLNGIKGNTDVNTSSGDVEINGVEGNLFVNTASGGSEIKNVNGELKAIATSGDIEVENVNNEIFLQTTSGEIDAESIIVNKSANLHSTSGEVSLGLIDNQDLQLDVTTSTGYVENGYDFDEQTLSENENFFKATSGTGEHIIHVVTTSGDVEISKD